MLLVPSRSKMIIFGLKAMPLPAVRSYQTKSGEVRTKCYTTIKGVDYGEYKRQQARQRYRNHVCPKVVRPRVVDRLSDEVVAAMKQQRDANTPVLKIATTYGVSRYAVKKALALTRG